ncbi:MAG: lysine biosynthesis protein LysX [Candidatus Bathyarchaeota archaeon]|nr:lysine biosynthesis protein LysX [Candidatus Bathyarchaeota archaeon]
MSKVGLVCDRIRWDEKALIRAATKAGLDLKLVDPKTVYIDTLEDAEKLKKEFGETVIQRCVSYFRGLHVTAVLENAGLQVINPFDVSLICGNKMFTTLALGKADIPVPKTLVAFTEEGVSKALEKLGYPAVLKPVVGSWGRLIALLQDRASAQAIIESREQMGNALLQIYYLQEYVQRPPRDIRVLVIGDEAVAASYRYSPKNDWRTNVARGGTSEPCPITTELEDLALKAAEVVGGGVLAVDCMESPEGLLVHEINSTVEFRGLYSATKVDIPGKIISYAVKVMKK